MAEVLEFKRPERPAGPDVPAHQVGEAFCVACDHRWAGVAPVGEVWLECPACRAHKGLFKFACAPAEQVYTCNCGNQFFHLTTRGHYCPNCGTYHRY